MTQALFDKYYYSRPTFVSGTHRFLEMCRREIPAGSQILDIGAGPTNDCTDAFATIGPVTGLDVDPDVKNNKSLVRAEVFDGRKMPFPDGSFHACTSNFVMEHVEFPLEHFQEVARVLKPGGVYCLRTPNLFHYVPMASNMIPHSLHLLLANRLRGLSKEAHDPYPTFYRANSRGKLRKLCRGAHLEAPAFTMVEPEPSYGRAHALLFYPMMMYERIVNSTSALMGLRVTILMAVRKAK